MTRTERNARRRSYYDRNREKILARRRAYEAGRRDVILAQKRAHYVRRGCRTAAVYRVKNAGKIRAAGNAWYRKWRKENPEKARKWKRANPGAVLAMTNRRKAHIRQATPAWADHKKIRAVYEKAARLTRRTGVPHHVDHEYPLRGKDGSRGLHVHYNLRIIPALDNLRKSNRMPV